VLQLPSDSIKDFDAMIELEDAISGGLGRLGDVDGHDVGSGEMNIFVVTDNPQAAFEKIKSLPDARPLLPVMKVAFRAVEGEDFTILHPVGLTDFEVA